MRARELGGRKLIIDLSKVAVICHEGENAIFDLMKERAEFPAGVFSPGTC
jgi:hypothetical protein